MDAKKINSLQSEEKRLSRACFWRTVGIAGFGSLALSQIMIESLGNETSWQSVVATVGSTIISASLVAEVIPLSQELSETQAQITQHEQARQQR